MVYDPAVISTEALLNEFWSGHRPIINRDRVSADPLASRDGRTDQYRSIILATNDEQLESALARRDALDEELGPGRQIATQISRLDEFNYAEDYHQQYVAKRSQPFSCA